LVVWNLEFCLAHGDYQWNNEKGNLSVRIN